MTITCPSCQREIEASYRDATCPSCGVVVQADIVRMCPRCDLPFEQREVEGIAVDECGQCGGLFLEHRHVQVVLADQDEQRATAFLGGLLRYYHPLPSPRQEVAECPLCRSPMRRRLSEGGSGVMLDVCTAHGTFYDVGRLHILVEYLQQTAVDRARFRPQEAPPSPDRSHEPIDPITTPILWLFHYIASKLPDR